MCIGQSGTSFDCFIRFRSGIGNSLRSEAPARSSPPRCAKVPCDYGNGMAVHALNRNGQVSSLKSYQPGVSNRVEGNLLVLEIHYRRGHGDAALALATAIQSERTQLRPPCPP